MLKSFRFGIGLVIAALTSAFTLSSAAAEEPVTMVTDGVYAFNPGQGYISMFMVTDEGVIAFESVNSAHAEGMLQAIKSVTDQPVKYLLHSHNHWDHSRGGQVFQAAGAKTIAHKEAYDWMVANPHDDMATPSEFWTGNSHEITLGGQVVEFHYFGINHGMGMTVFRLPEQKVAYIADLVTPDRVMFTIMPDFNVNETLRSLAEVEALDFDKAVYSHSHSPSAVNTKEPVKVSQAYIKDLQAAIVQEFQKGTPFGQIPTTVKLPQYAHLAQYDEWLSMNVWRVMLDMAMGPFPWRPVSD